MNEVRTKKKFRMFPEYRWLLPAAIAVIHMAVYLGTKLINGGMYHHDLTIGLDRLIPFDPRWALIYVLTFIFWVAGLISAAWEEHELCLKLFTAVIISELICAVFFIALPTSIARPEPVLTGQYTDTLIAAIYSSDVPSNLFPSMHCMMAYLVFRGMVLSPRYKPVYCVLGGILTVLICISTLYIKQHFFLDVVAGLAFGEIAVQLALRTRAWTLLDRLCKKVLQSVNRCDSFDCKENRKEIL